MNRNEIAQELNVWPWDVDDWLLWGCPARKVRTEWEFNLEAVKAWLKHEKIRIRRAGPKPASAKPAFDRRWYGKRCPICMDRGFPGDSAGRLYTFGEIFDGEWHLRRTGLPCGHSANLKYVG
jgi:hypothetical protein